MGDRSGLTAHVRGPAGYLPPVAQRSLLALPHRVDFLLEHAGTPTKRILDVGCASGYIARILREVGHDVVGIELNELMAADARELGIPVIEHDLEEPLPLACGSFDVVHACEIIEHLFDTERFLRELHRVLVDGGVLVLSTPNLNSLGNRLRVMGGRSLPMWGAYPADRHGGHVRVLNKPKVVELLQRTGFRLDACTGINRLRAAPLLDRLPTWSEMMLVKAVRLP